jgi:hypothetical protein
MKLTHTQIKAAQPKPSRYRLFDGDGLYVVVRSSGSKAWEYRYQDNNRLRVVILGAAEGSDAIGIAAARAERDRLKVARRAGADVRLVVRAERADPVMRNARIADAPRARHAAAERANYANGTAIAPPAKRPNGKPPAHASFGMTVRQMCDAWVASDPNGWNDGTLARVANDFTNHVYPVVGDRDVATIESADVLRLLAGIIAAGRVETARKIKQRLQSAFNWAVLAYDLPRNPVAPLAQEFTKRLKAARRVNPETSMPCVDAAGVPALLAAMRRYTGTPHTRTLMYLLSWSVVRTTEARLATWSEFEFSGDDACVWTIPAARMKQVGSAREPHVVALPRQAVAMLLDLRELTGNGPKSFVFAHPRKSDRPCSENAVLAALAEMGYSGRHSGHGFRTMFSTHCNEAQKNKDLVEACLAHGEPDKVRGAYNRATWNAARADLLQWYADELERLETAGKGAP